MKELHSREGIGPGRTLIISPTESYNGTYGWLDFPYALEPGFVTVAQTGSIGEAFVQLEPCAVNDDCLVLLPKEGRDPNMVMFVLAAATLHAERWRFNYGRKLTPSRIAHFALPDFAAVEGLDRWKDQIDQGSHCRKSWAVPGGIIVTGKPKKRPRKIEVRNPRYAGATPEMVGLALMRTKSAGGGKKPEAKPDKSGRRARSSI